MTEISATTVETTETGTDRYVIDGRSSRFTVRAFATGLLAAMGHNPTIGVRDFSGDIKFNPETLEAGSLKVVVKSSSLSVQDDISAKDLREMERLMNQEVRETKYPEIVYESPPVSLTRRADMLSSATLTGNPIVAWRLPQSANQCTDRILREYATCVWGVLAKPDRLQHQAGFGSRRGVKAERRAHVFLRDSRPERRMNTLVVERPCSTKEVHPCV